MGWMKGLTSLAVHAAPPTVARVLGWGAVAGVLVGLVWAHPASPCALWRGDVALGNGRPHAAVARYDDVARTHPSEGVRAEALRRSALLWEVELGHPSQARARLEELLRLAMTDTERADVLERVGLLLLDEGHPLEAARRLREAHDVDPQASDAPQRLVRSARAAASAGDLTLAERTWRRLGKLHPVHLARANVGRGHLRLQRGDAEGALTMYEAGVDHAYDPDVAAVARLGVATCLERLGDLDQALAELDAAELPPEVLDRRAGSIKARDALVVTPR